MRFNLSIVAIILVLSRIKFLQEQIENGNRDPDYSNEILAQKEEMIKCLQNELIKVNIIDPI